MATIGKHGSQIGALAISPDDSVVATGHEDGEIRVWSLGDTPSDRLLGSHTRGVFESAGVTSLAYALDGQMLVSGGWDDTLRAWEVTSGQLLYAHDLNVDDSFVRDVSIAPSRAFVAAAGCYGRIAILEASTGDLVADVFCEESSSSGFDVESVTFSPDGLILAAAYDARILFCKVGSWQLTPFLERRKNRLRRFRSMRFARDGRLIAACCSNPDAVFVWEVDSGKQVCRFDGRWYALAFSADGAWLAVVGGRLPLVALCDVESGREIHRSELPSEVFAVDVARDSRTVVCGLFDGSVMALDVAPVVA